MVLKFSFNIENYLWIDRFQRPLKVRRLAVPEIMVLTAAATKVLYKYNY